MRMRSSRRRHLLFTQRIHSTMIVEHLIVIGHGDEDAEAAPSPPLPLFIRRPRASPGRNRIAAIVFLLCPARQAQAPPDSCSCDRRLLLPTSDHGFLFLVHHVRESEEGGEEGDVLVPVRGGRRHRLPEHWRARGSEPGSVPAARLVLRLQASRLPRPPAPRLRDRNLHARWGIHPPRLLRTQGHHQDRRCAVDDGWARHRALGDAGGRRRAQGPAALDQPRLQGQDDRATVPGAREQGHQPGREGRRGGEDHRRGSLRGAIAGLYTDTHHVHGLHDATRVAAPPANPRGLERLRVHHRGGGRVRQGGHGAGERAQLPRARRRRWPQRVEPVRRAAAVRAGGRAAVEGASGAAGALRHELSCPDPAGHGGLLLWPQRLREGQPVELHLNLIGLSIR